LGIGKWIEIGEDEFMPYDAVIVVSFGGPETRDEVIPFLETVLRGRNVPHERLLEVAGHYYHFGGKSPINDHNCALVAALQAELDRNGPRLHVYWGNRNWHPFLAETLRQMKAEGIERALAFVTSAYSSYCGCRQYLEDIAKARAEVGDGAPVVDKLRVFFNHPDFIAALADRARQALAQIPVERRSNAPIVYTAHSVPLAMAQTSQYVQQLEEACRLVSQALGGRSGRLVYQSRSGPPSQPWLGPDILPFLAEIKASGARDVVIVPIGFTSDHMEVLYDLDTEARARCQELGLNMVRAATPGNHPKFIGMIRELILERMEPGRERRALGSMGAAADVCPADCCPPPARPHSPAHKTS
jgi:protoporphyrin/coproporphyrin ferrochelatase